MANDGHRLPPHRVYVTRHDELFRDSRLIVLVAYSKSELAKRIGQFPVEFEQPPLGKPVGNGLHKQ